MGLYLLGQNYYANKTFYGLLTQLFYSGLKYTETYSGNFELPDFVHSQRCHKGHTTLDFSVNSVHPQSVLGLILGGPADRTKTFLN